MVNLEEMLVKYQNLYRGMNEVLEQRTKCFSLTRRSTTLFYCKLYVLGRTRGPDRKVVQGHPSSSSIKSSRHSTTRYRTGVEGNLRCRVIDDKLRDPLINGMSSVILGHIRPP